MNKRKKRALRSPKSLERILSICSNCGEPGRHFAPPSMGEPGFFTCEKKVA